MTDAAFQAEAFQDGGFDAKPQVGTRLCVMYERFSRDRGYWSLFPTDTSRWTGDDSDNLQPQNWIELDRTQGVMRFHNYGQVTPVSKSQLVKQNFVFPENGELDSRVRMRIIAPSAPGLFILDLEGENMPGRSPGMRVYNSGGFLTVDRGKMGRGKIQSTGPMPIGDWFDVRMVLILSPDPTVGRCKLYLNGELVLNAVASTMPERELFASLGFPLPDYLYFDKINIGVTANQVEPYLVIEVSETDVFFDPTPASTAQASGWQAQETPVSDWDVVHTDASGWTEQTTPATAWSEVTT